MSHDNKYINKLNDLEVSLKTMETLNYSSN